MTSSPRNPRVLVMSPRAGLAARIRAVISAIILAEHLGRDLKLLWIPDNECCCRFTDLFESTFDEVSENYPDQLPMDARYQKGDYKLAKTTVLPISCIGANTYVIPDSMFDDDEPVYYLETSARFHPETMNAERYAVLYHKYLNELLMPHRDVRAALIDLPAKTYGVHMRRGNSEDTTTVSRVMQKKAPDRVFAERMANAVAMEGPELHFYLASDSQMTKRHMVRIFGDRIIHRDVARRNSVQGVRDALIDMLMLSKTRRVIISGWSSFGVVAAQFRGTPLEIVK